MRANNELVLALEGAGPALALIGDASAPRRLNHAVLDANLAVKRFDFNVDGRYWSQFNRANPIEAAAREKAWTGTAHALIAELGVGSVTASTLQMGLGLAGLFAALGLTLIVAGLGLVWATRPETARAPVLSRAPMPA